MQMLKVLLGCGVCEKIFSQLLLEITGQNTDSHFRIGGAMGTGLQVAECPASADASCK